MDSRPDSPRSIFYIAHEITDLAERNAYLDRVCALQPQLRAEVEALLKAHEAAGDFMKQPAADQLPLSADGDSPADPAGTVDEVPDVESIQLDLKPGAMIGEFRLVRRIGKGGMGIVFEAEQLQPLNRRVALKIINPNRISKHHLDRFRIEQQALTRMQHPNVALVYEAGQTREGVPFSRWNWCQAPPVQNAAMSSGYLFVSDCFYSLTSVREFSTPIRSESSIEI